MVFDTERMNITSMSLAYPTHVYATTIYMYMLSDRHDTEKEYFQIRTLNYNGFNASAAKAIALRAANKIVIGSSGCERMRLAQR